MEHSLEQRVFEVLSRSQKMLTGEVTIDKTFEELGVDSVDGINLLYDIEEEFKITMPYELNSITTVREMISVIQELLAKKSPIHVATIEKTEELFE